MLSMLKLAAMHFRHLKKNEDGLALTEYLILLGLLTAAVIAAVLLFGENLGTAWNDWAVWLGDNTSPPPASTGTGG